MMVRLVARICSVFLLLAVTATAGHAARQPGDDAPFDSLAGRFLVATPSLDDPNFDRTVVYLVEHNADGAMGLVINRVVATGPLDRLLAELGLEGSGGAEGEIRVHYGGPVEQERAFVLHSRDYESEATVPLPGGVALTASLDVLRDIAKGKGPSRRLLAVGYAGWGPNQLETEIAAGAWITIPADTSLLFDDEVETKWQRALERRGVDL